MRHRKVLLSHLTEEMQVRAEDAISWETEIPAGLSYTHWIFIISLFNTVNIGFLPLLVPDALFDQTKTHRQ